MLVSAVLITIIALAHCQNTETFGIDEQSFSVYVKLLQLSQQHGWKLKLPKLAVTGIQGAGKSTLLERYLDFPVDHNARDTARCPIQYTLQRSAPGSNIEIIFEGKKISPEQLSNQLEESMELITKNSPTGFSEKFLHVEVISPSVPNIVFVDLPYLIINPFDKQKEIAVQTLVANVVRDPSFFIIAVVKCQETISSIRDLTILDTVFSSSDVESTLPPRTDWEKKAVFVVHRLNNYVDYIRTNEDANQIFSQAAEEQRFFVVSNPNNFVKDVASYEEKQKFIAELPKKETKWFDDFKAELEQRSSRDQVWNPENDKILGFTPTKKKISALWMASLHEQMPEIIQHVTDEFNVAKDKLIDAEYQLSMANVTKFLSLYREYSIDFVETLNCDLFPTLNFTTHRYYEFLPIKATTWEEDQAFAESTFGHASQFVPEKFFRTITETIDSLNVIEEHVGFREHSLRKDISRKYIRATALARLLSLLEYGILAIFDVDDDTIYSIATAWSTNIDKVNWMGVILKVTRIQIQRMKPATGWLKYYAVSIFYRYTQNVREYLLTSKYEALHEHDFFLDLMDNTYLEHITDALRIVQSRWEQDLEVYSNEREILYAQKPSIEKIPATSRWFGSEEGYNDIYHYPSLWSEVSYDYLRSISREFYVSLAKMLTHSLTASVNHFFLGTVNNKAAIQNHLLVETRKITEDMILKSLDIPVEYLRARVEKTRQEYEDAGDALETLNIWRTR